MTRPTNRALNAALATFGVICPAAAPAQNPLSLSGGTTSYTSRAGVVGAVELFSTYGMREIRGAVPGAVLGQFTSARVVVQDQAGVTPAGFDFVLGSSPTTLTVVSNLTLPPSTQSGPVAWGFTVTFAAYSPQPGGDVVAGVRLPAAPQWTSDGLSVHQSADQTNPQAPQHSFARDVATGVVQTTQDASWRMSLELDEPVAEAGVFLARGLSSYGRSGLYPDHLSTGGRGLVVRVHDAQHPGSQYVVFAAPGGFGAPYSQPAVIDGLVHLNLVGSIPWVIAAGAIRSQPDDMEVLPLGMALPGDVVLQAVSLRPGAGGVGLVTSTAIAVRP